MRRPPPHVWTFQRRRTATDGDGCHNQGRLSVSQRRHIGKRVITLQRQAELVGSGRLVGVSRRAWVDEAAGVGQNWSSRGGRTVHDGRMVRGRAGRYRTDRGRAGRDRTDRGRTGRQGVSLFGGGTGRHRRADSDGATGRHPSPGRSVRWKATRTVEVRRPERRAAGRDGR